ncbi:MAG TPA: universal stress protein, partial [Rhodothermales bacterium]|nr:universal stress protein [Rhodothermales bacterium]
ARGICAYAAEAGVGLIVMSTHGRRGASRLLLGSVAETVLRRAPCPVLVVPSTSDATCTAAALDGALVLAADDLTDAAASALREGARLAGLLGGTLDVLHVVEPPYVPAPYGLLPPEAFSLETVIPRIKAALATRAAKARVPVRYHVRAGDPADAIAEAAREGGAALVVVGSHGRQGVDRVLMGSTAEALVRQAPCPVLVVRPLVPSPPPA